eukprot:1107505-Prymnesium_polylepis.1
MQSPADLSAECEALTADPSALLRRALDGMTRVERWAQEQHTGSSETTRQAQLATLRKETSRGFGICKLFSDVWRQEETQAAVAYAATITRIEFEQRSSASPVYVLDDTALLVTLGSQPQGRLRYAVVGA